MDGVINVNNPDLAYMKFKDMYDLLRKSSDEILDLMFNNINSMKIHWVGTDATVHINRLIEIRKRLDNVFIDGSDITSFAANRIVDIQRLRQANGGTGVVNDTLTKYAPNCANIELVVSTTEYYVDPEAAQKDLNDLKEIKAKFESFYSTFVDTKEEVMGLWHSGARRERALAYFGELEQERVNFINVLDLAINDFEIAVKNSLGGLSN